MHDPQRKKLTASSLGKRRLESLVFILLRSLAPFFVLSKLPGAPHNSKNARCTTIRPRRRGTDRGTKQRSVVNPRESKKRAIAY